MTHGIDAVELGDEDLERELSNLLAHRHEMLTTGSADQFRVNTERTSELEREFVRRFADRITDAEQKAAQLG
jgi:hypothetical protein